MTARRTCLITGASRGIGAAIAWHLALAGWDLLLVSRTEPTLAQFAQDLPMGPGARAHYLAADMGDPDDVDRVAAWALTRVPQLDALIISAGMGAIGPLESFPLRRLEKMLTINVRAPYALVQSLLPALRVAGTESPHGAKVIALASLTGLVGQPLNSAYGATKAALISLCETLNTEESTRGVLATAVCPGYVATDMTTGITDTVPADTMLHVEDVALMVVSRLALSSRVVIPTLVMTRPSPNLWQA